MMRNTLARQFQHLSSRPLLPSRGWPLKSYACRPSRTALFRSTSYAYTTSTEPAAGESVSETHTVSPDGSPAQGQKPPQTELETKNREIIDLKDKYLRSVAEFRNLQDRTQRDIKQARQFALTGFARDLIESVDNLDRALSTVDPESLPKSDQNASESSSESSSGGAPKALNDLYQGLKMTDSILMSTLKKHGLERIDPTGEKFDPNLHDAAFMTMMKDKEDGTVFDVIQKGFLLNGRVVRAAKVGVVKNT